MVRLTDDQLARVARGAGFQGDALVWAVAVALAESGGNTAAVGRNADSVDRGLWQINSKWHPEVSAAQAFNPQSNAAAAYRISSGGKSWKPWSTYNSGSAAVMRPRAARAVTKARLTGATDAKLPIPDVIPGDGTTLDPFDWFKGDSPGPDGLTDPFGLFGEGLVNPLDGLKALVSFIGKAYTWIADPHNWVRIFLVTGGGTAVLLGFKLLADSGRIGQTAQSVSGKVSQGTKLAAGAAVGGPAGAAAASAA